MGVRCRAVFVRVPVCAFKDARVFQTCGRAEGAHGRRFERAHGDVFNAHPHTHLAAYTTRHTTSHRAHQQTLPFATLHIHQHAPLLLHSSSTLTKTPVFTLFDGHRSKLEPQTKNKTLQHVFFRWGYISEGLETAESGTKQEHTFWKVEHVSCNTLRGRKEKLCYSCFPTQSCHQRLCRLFSSFLFFCCLLSSRSTFFTLRPLFVVVVSSVVSFFFSRSLSLAYALSALCLSPFSRFALCVLGCGLSVFVVVVCSVPVLMSSHLAFGPLRDGWMGGVLCGGHIYWNTHTHTGQ